MKLNKVILASALALGLFAFDKEASASEWKARGVEEVKSELVTEDNTTSYTIKYGDTLGVIGKASGLSVKELASINDIDNVDFILPGNKVSFEEDESGNIDSVSITNEQEEVLVEETVTEEPVVTAPVAEEVPYSTPEYVEEEETYEPQASTSSEQEAKEWIIQKESNGNPQARNGQYYGLFQLGDHLIEDGASVQEQHAVANNYVNERYGSWAGAKQAWQQKGWY
ncbi:LysM domain protein [Aerococcus phage vB_AviM_AVP]|nr:LysM domain protein [Aerococcus phage vB_AviM_AVP]